jgi:2-polyprenyl-3-methyl-5-hydroxy-6-metoxy-1,4-benzoquinol methylase
MECIPQPSRFAASPRPSSQRQCDLCGGTQFEPVSERDRHGGDLATVICTRCGLVGHLHIPGDEQLADFYGKQYRLEYNGEHTPSPRRVMRAWRNSQIICRRLAPLLRPGDRVFEVGAGTGSTVKRFELAGFSASGIEPGEGFSNFARETLHANVQCQDLFDLPTRPNYDLVLLVHVIEHFNSPSRALARIHALLKPGGRLYVECPNLSAPFTIRSRLFHSAHIHNFTHSTLSMLAEKCGFRIETQYSDDHDPNLKVLLRRAESGRLVVDSESYAQTLRDLERNNARTYYLRWRYLWARLQKSASYLREYVCARRVLRQILKECQAAGSS